MTAVELVRLDQAEVGAEQIGHGVVTEPFAVQPPFAARRDQSICHEGLENLIPPRTFATQRQARCPERVEL